MSRSYDAEIADPRESTNHAYHRNITTKMKAALVRSGEVTQEDNIHCALQGYVDMTADDPSSSDIGDPGDLPTPDDAMQD